MVKEIEILDRNDITNTSNTSNTFWKGVERNGTHNNSSKSDGLTNSGQKTIGNEGNGELKGESNNNSLIGFIENEGTRPAKVLEVLEVLEREKDGK